MPSAARRPTLADVGRLAGTSTAVVSYVLNDGPRPVAAATRARVEEAIRMLGYRRNHLAGALSGGRSNLVGLLVPDTANGFFGELCHHVEAEGRRRGYLTLVGNTGYDAALAIDYGFAFSELRPRGTFVTGGEVWPQEDGTARVYLLWAPEGTRWPSVIFNDLDGSVTAVEHLLGHGYRDVHCLRGDRGVEASHRREEGWRRAMGAAGLSTEGRVHHVSFERVDAESQVMDLLRDPSRPRAVFASTDEQALATARAAGKLGLRIPDDLALVGFDGIREARLGSTNLTTVSVPLDRLATEAFDALERVDGEDTTPAVTVLDGALRIGTSCGCPEPSAGRRRAPKR